MYWVFTWVIIGLLIVVSVAAYWMAKSITWPVLALKKGTQIIAAGKFDYRVIIKSRDEIEELAGEYNRMAANLKGMYANLEQRVTERTRELVEANALLKMK